MHRANMVRDVVVGLKKFLHQEQFTMELDHVANIVQRTKKKLATKLQQMQSMMQVIQM